MYALLKRLDSLDLIALAAIGGRRALAGVEEELDRRAASAHVRRILGDARAAGPKRVARRPAGPVLAA